MPIWWIYLLLASMVVLIAGAILVAIESMDKTNTDAGAILLTIGFVFFAVVSILIYYQLVKRQNEHFKREAMERAAMVSWFRDRAQEMGRLQFIGPQLGAMESINQEAQFKEKELSIIFIILLIIPIVDIVVMLYLLYAFTKMPFEHDQRWHHFTQNAQMAGQQLGVNIMMPSWKTQSERSFVIYLVLTIIISVFMIYWLYVIIKDLNEHMKNQWAFEDQLLREMNR
jgi:hypothetical protein